MRDRGYQISWNCNRSIDLTEIIGETMSASGQTRSFGFVGSMSGLPETGHDLQPADGRAERERHRRRAKMSVTVGRGRAAV